MTDYAREAAERLIAPVYWTGCRISESELRDLEVERSQNVNAIAVAIDAATADIQAEVERLTRENIELREQLKGQKAKEE